MKRKHKIMASALLLFLAAFCPPLWSGNILAGLIGIIIGGRELYMVIQMWKARRAMIEMDRPTIVPVRGGMVVFRESDYRVVSRFVSA